MWLWQWLLPRQLGVIPALIAGGAALAGGLLTNKTNAKTAAKQMEFQREQAATAHQREVKDLRAAGLNPILSGTGGMGAASGGGAGFASADLSGSVGSAIAGRRSKAEVDLMKEDERLRIEQGQLAEQQGRESKARQTNLSAQTVQLEDQNALTRQLTETEKHKTDQAQHEAEILRNEAKGARVEGEIDEGWGGTVSRYLRRFVNPSSAAELIRRGRR